MKNDAARGWKKVFGFTFTQQVHSKSFIVGTVIVCIIVMLLVGGMNIIPKLAGAGELLTGNISSETIDLSAVYLIDDSGTLTADDAAVLEQSGVKLSKTDKSAAELIDALSQADAGKALVTVTADRSDGEVLGYAVKTYYSPDTDSGSVDTLSGLVSGLVTYRNMMNAGVSPENYAATQRYVTASKIQAGADEWNVFETMINYVVPMVISLGLFILIFAYGQMVAQSIATEKTSRVMELLLTSVRPLAIVIGKVLAMGLVSLLQFMLIGAVGGISFAVTAPFGIGGDLIKIMQNTELQVGENAAIAEAVNGSFGSLSPLTFILIFVIFVLGFLLFALIAALVGASVSRMEDLAQAMQPYSLLGVLGFYLAYFPSIMTMDSLDTGAASDNAMQTFACFFPVSSPFALPSALLLGNLSLPEVLSAVLILAASVVLVAVIVARVYELIILHSGSRLKFMDIIRLAGKK
ncbi:MAG: ABC transporter permease [Oscillospiraceae bacterium]|nr:ABC transporter permease [Oscillospiraceae bacterium]